MPTQPVIKRLAHLGLIAAFFHEIGLPLMMDSGDHSRTLHIFSNFFEAKPVSRLLAKDVKAHHLTDDVLMPYTKPMSQRSLRLLLNALLIS